MHGPGVPLRFTPGFIPAPLRGQVALVGERIPDHRERACGTEMRCGAPQRRRREGLQPGVKRSELRDHKQQSSNNSLKGGTDSRNVIHLSSGVSLGMTAIYLNFAKISFASSSVSLLPMSNQVPLI